MNDIPHMTPDEFRKHGREVVDWIARYMETVEQFPVLSQAGPGETRSQLPEAPPEEGESFDAMMADVDKIIMPGITHWQSPYFFGFFPANISAPSILGELLTAGLGVQGMIWATSPACTEVETLVLDWLVGMLGLPGKFKSDSQGGGVIQDTASSSSLCAMLAARERATNFASNEKGITQTLTAYTSNQAHSSIEKGVKIIGIGREHLRLIDVDETFAMKPAKLQEAISADRAAGLTPFFVSATVGTTSSNGFDPLTAIGEICSRENLWMHVDAAMSGTAALCEEFRDIHDGLEYADSYCFNPHKWMLTNFDCDCFYVADRAALINTLSILPEYLRNQASESGEVFDYRDWHIPLGRRFRALKLWFVIRHYGVNGLKQHVREHISHAQAFASWVKSDDNFEIAAPHPLTLVCFRHKGDDAINQCILDRLNHSGKMFLTHTKLDGKLTLRMSIGATATKREHVRQAWTWIREAAQACESND